MYHSIIQQTVKINACHVHNVAHWSLLYYITIQTLVRRFTVALHITIINNYDIGSRPMEKQFFFLILLTFILN